MQPARHHTAILLFAHKAEQEATRKSFTGLRQIAANKNVAHALLNHTLNVCAQTGLPLLKVYAAQQVGSTFGERLANAFALVFAAGYRQVICIGSDCPTLKYTDIQLAQAKLSQSQLVLGPATDGGVYLIGMQQSHFNARRFAQLTWQSDKVLAELTQYAAAQHADCCLLTEKSDVDTHQDLRHTLAHLPADGILFQTLTAILFAEATVFAAGPFCRKTSTAALADLHLRAPPAHLV